jgi:hypothetical protein
MHSNYIVLFIYLFVIGKTNVYTSPNNNIINNNNNNKHKCSAIIISLKNLFPRST